jgi:hypothetical protein
LLMGCGGGGVGCAWSGRVVCGGCRQMHALVCACLRRMMPSLFGKVYMLYYIILCYFMLYVWQGVGVGTYVCVCVRACVHASQCELH